MRVAQMADGFDLPVSVMNCPGNFMAEFAAVLPNHIWMEVVDAGQDVVFNHDSRVEDGYIILGDSAATAFNSMRRSSSSAALRRVQRAAAPSPLGSAAWWGIVYRGGWRGGKRWGRSKLTTEAQRAQRIAFQLHQILLHLIVFLLYIWIHLSIARQLTMSSEFYGYYLGTICHDSGWIGCLIYLFEIHP